MATPKSSKKKAVNTKPKFDNVPMDNHEETKRREMVDVQTVGKALQAPYKAITGHASFKNEGGMVNFVTAVNNSDKPATIKFLSVDGKQDKEQKLAPNEVYDFAHRS